MKNTYTIRTHSNYTLMICPSYGKDS